MKLYSTLLMSAAFVTLIGANANAACRDEIASLSPGTTTSAATGATANTQSQGIAKDGTHAPLQTGSVGATGSGQGATGTARQGEGVSKDGSTMPLANSPGGGNRNVATSQQDVQSQQQGGQPAAAAAQSAGNSQASGNRSPEMMAALNRAQSLLQQGDEAGCMQAVGEAKRMR